MSHAEIRVNYTFPDEWTDEQVEAFLNEAEVDVEDAVFKGTNEVIVTVSCS
jgi:hypothetical protein